MMIPETFKNYKNYSQDELIAMGLTWKEINGYNNDLQQNKHEELINRICHRFDDFYECYEYAWDYLTSASEFASGMLQLLDTHEDAGNIHALLHDIGKICSYKDYAEDEAAYFLEDNEQNHADALNEQGREDEYTINYSMDELEDYLAQLDPVEAFNLGMYSKELCFGEEYFYEDEVGHLVSTDLPYTFMDDFEETKELYYWAHREDWISSYLDDIEAELEILDRDTLEAIMSRIYKNK